MCTVTDVESRLEDPLKMEAALKDSREERGGKAPTLHFQQSGDGAGKIPPEKEYI